MERNDPIGKILASRQPAGAEGEQKGDKFYGLLLGDGVAPAFLDVRLRSGGRLGIDYTNLDWLYYDPEAGTIELEFGSVALSVRGRGLAKIYESFLRRRVEWIKEADSELQDSKENETYISDIVVISTSEATATD